MKNAARVMQLNILIPQTIIFLMVHDTHHVNVYKNILYTKYTQPNGKEAVNGKTLRRVNTFLVITVKVIQIQY